jgi:hypothetical protein
MFIFRRPLAAVAAGLGAALLVVILDRACERSGTLAAEGHGGALDRPLARLPGESQSPGADVLRGEVNSWSETFNGATRTIAPLNFSTDRGKCVKPPKPARGSKDFILTRRQRLVCLS